jgi:peptidoglycan/LPS O-acetylase OafA/YrhL
MLRVETDDSYRKEIDGLRAIAVMPVLFFHAGFKVFEGGFVGVDIFFVISGYLISKIILFDLQNNRFSFARFYERRARRIFPALYLVMFLCLPFSWLWMLPNQLKDFSESLVAVSAFLSNILFWRESDYFAMAAELKPLLHTWSLAVEEQYYVLFPIFLLFFWNFRRQWIFWSLFLIGLASLLIAQWGAYIRPAATFYLLPTRIWELALGALISFYFYQSKSSRVEMVESIPKISNGLSILGVLLIFYSVAAFDKKTPFPGFYALIPTVGAGLIIVFSTPKTLVGRFLGSKPLVGLGLISYSLYLWHQPLFAFARQRSLTEPGAALLIGLIFIAILGAYLSWRFVERPFRNKNKVSLNGILIFSIAGFAVYTTIGIAGIVTDGFIHRFHKDLHPLLTIDNNPRYSGLHAARLIDKNFSNDGRSKILIIGDSYAQDLINAIFEKGYDDQLDISFHKIPGDCGNLYLHDDFSDKLDPRDSAECRNIGWYAPITDRIKQADSVWLSSSWNDWIAPLVGQSIRNLTAEYGNKFIIFGTKSFGEIDLRKLLRETLKNDPISLFSPVESAFFDFAARFNRFLGSFWAFWVAPVVLYAPCGRSNPSDGQQGLFGDDQIGQGEEHLMLGTVLLETFVT